MKTRYPLLILILLGFQSNAQRILVEEFTNVQLPSASESSAHLDSLTDGLHQVCVIRYHTDIPTGDPFNQNVTSAVESRINRVGGIENFPTVIVDGQNRPTGNQYAGATLNTTAAYLDSIRNAKQPRISFFGLALNFSDDFTDIYGSSGMVLTNSNTDLPVKHYRALVEKVVDTNNPIGPNGQTQFKHIFRGWISNGISNTIPGNGSTHGWSKFDLPSSIVNLNNLHMVVFVTTVGGEVLDCTMVSAGSAPAYALRSTNNTSGQETVCDSIVVPRIKIKNTGVNPIEGVAIKTTIGDSSYLDFRSDTIYPAEEKTFLLEERTMVLSRGTHYIDVKVDYILNAPGQGSFTSSNGPTRYLVARAHEWEDVGFEDFPDNSFGPIIIRSKVDAALKVVDSADIGASHPVGAFGMSDHALMVDCWTWPWDEDDAGTVSNVDNKNFAYLYFDHFPLDHIKQPVLKFDVASANKPNHKCIEVAGRPWTCTRNPRIMKTFTGNDILSTATNTTSRYVPEPEDWKTHTTDLYYFKDSEQTHLRLKFTNHVDFTRPNAFYIDNIRIESNERICGTGDAIFRAQADVDSFFISHPDCNTIDGDLLIGSQDSLSDIRNLEGLQNINTINGALRIVNNPIMDDVSGLSRLREIHGEIEIVNNDSLRTMEGLQTISTGVTGYLLADNEIMEEALSISVINMEGSVQLVGNSNLRRFSVDVTHINGDLIVTGSPFLSIPNFEFPLETVSGDMIFEGLDRWTSFRRFDNMRTIQGDLSIKNCGTVSFLGLNNIDTIVGDLIIEENFDLERIFLYNFHFVGGRLVVSDNDRLKDISGLDSISYESIGSLDTSLYDVILTENDSLEVCDTELFCRLVADNDKSYQIQQNGQGCNTGDEINLACTTTSTQQISELQYRVYPNPFNDQINIQVDRYVNVRILSIDGRNLYQNDFGPGNHRISMPDLSPGMYLIMFGNEVIEKVVKN